MSGQIGQKWSVDRAQDWWEARRWVCGFNFLPSSAVNFLELWMAETFDRKTITRELGFAADAGFNAVRVNLHFLVWKHDRDGLIERIEWFLDTASGLGLDTVLVPFDDCGFGGGEPEYGPQPDPIMNVHNSRAVASPGRAAVMDRSQWSDFEAFLRDIVRQFRRDERILFWDLYNEPGNQMIFTPTGYREYTPALTEHSRDLMLAAFEWARDERPEQPLTVGAWRTAPPGSDAVAFDNEIDRLALALSDIVTFHAYCSRAEAETLIDHLAPLGRPMLTTEWMARAVGSLFADQLALYHEHDVGCFNWGLVKGRTQTQLPWPEALVARHGRATDADVWFHDVFWPDGSPYDADEVRLIRTLTSTHR